MKLLSDYADLLAVAPFYMGVLWAADKFCKKFLGISKGKERLFLILSFCSWLSGNILGRLSFSLYIFSVLLYPVFFIGLVMVLFGSEVEKRILAASILLAAERLVSEFCGSLLSCLALFFLHTVKKIPEPLIGDWGGRLVSGAGCCFAISAIYWLSRHLEPVFCGRRGKWYVILAVPMLVNAAVYEAESLGASNGIMVRSAGSMGLYYDQIFSHSEFLVLALLSMAAAGFYVFGMNRIYLEQEKTAGTIRRSRSIKCWWSSTGSQNGCGMT